MFKITSGRGFHITFPNGIILSTQFGYGNYCDNYNNDKLMNMGSNPINGFDLTNLTCEDVEVEIFCEAQLLKDTWLTEDMHREVFGVELDSNVMGNVMGHVDIIQWLKILDWCKNSDPREIMLKRK